MTESMERRPRGPWKQGLQTRESILNNAAQLASVIGLENVSIGVLAEQLGISKSGLYAHFGSKQQLQLDTLIRAEEIFVEEAMKPAWRRPKGLPRLWALVTGFLSYIDRSVFSGGCAVAQAVADFDARSGPVHEEAQRAMEKWRAALARAVREAVSEGHLRPEADPEQLAFELSALLQGTNLAHRVSSDRSFLERCAVAARDRLDSFATGAAPKLELNW